MEQFEIEGSLGAGSFATVLKVKRKTTKNVYAMKRVNVSKMKHVEICQTMNEIRILASINHQHIVRFYECFQVDGSEICIILEYCANGDLGQEIERKKRTKTLFEESKAWKYLSQLLQALHVLHKHNIVHRDVKAANCFLGEEDSIKLGDMNVSKCIKNGIFLQTQTGTPYYMSPEIFENQPYDQACDIWALGVVFYEICALRKPFVGTCITELCHKVMNEPVPPLKHLIHPYSRDVSLMINLLLRKSPIDRPNAKELLECTLLQRNLSSHLLCNTESEDRTEMLKTIFVPEDLPSIAVLEEKFPRPCYPDEEVKFPEMESTRSRSSSLSWFREEEDETQHVQCTIQKEQPATEQCEPIKLKEIQSDVTDSIRSPEQKPTKNYTKSLSPRIQITPRSSVQDSEKKQSPLPPRSPPKSKVCPQRERISLRNFSDRQDSFSLAQDSIHPKPPKQQTVLSPVKVEPRLNSNMKTPMPAVHSLKQDYLPIQAKGSAALSVLEAKHTMENRKGDGCCARPHPSATYEEGLHNDHHVLERARSFSKEKRDGCYARPNPPAAFEESCHKDHHVLERACSFSKEKRDVCSSRPNSTAAFEDGLHKGQRVLERARSFSKEKRCSPRPSQPAHTANSVYEAGLHKDQQALERACSGILSKEQRSSPHTVPHAVSSALEEGLLIDQLVLERACCESFSKEHPCARSGVGMRMEPPTAAEFAVNIQERNMRYTGKFNPSERLRDKAVLL